MNQPTNPERAQDKQDAAEVKNFTRSPNMLIFGYRELSPQEKWLYVCLKHLCGKRGTRHLALRYISEQTGISVGALSTSKDKKGNVNEGMIRHLHNAGLIHSEIKKKDGKGNAQYHITITDVWDLNQTFFIERAKSRSEFGQDTGQEEDESTEPVRISDEPVQNSDKSVRKPDKVVQNSDEPVRIPGQYQERYKTTDKTDNKTTEQESDSAPESHADDSGSVEPTRTHALSDVSQVVKGHDDAQSSGPQNRRPASLSAHRMDSGAHGERGAACEQAQGTQAPNARVRGHAPEATRDTASERVAGENDTRSQLSTSMTTYPQQSAKVEPEKPSKGRNAKVKTEPVLAFTPEGRKVYDAWCSLFKSPPRTAEKTVDCANDLYARLVPWCKELRWTCAQLLDDMRKWEYATDPDYYRKRGVTLCDLGRDFERWQSMKTEELERAKKPNKTTQEQSPLELLRAQQQRYAQLPAKG